MASPGDARADGPPSPHRGAPFRGSWLSTWAGDDTRPAGQQTVLKSGWCEGILIMGLTSVIPSWSSGPHLPTASLHPSAESGGGRGIRTPGTLPGTVVFKTTAIDHSAIPPRQSSILVARLQRRSPRPAHCHPSAG